jgi:hypothetical protein
MCSTYRQVHAEGRVLGWGTERTPAVMRSAEVGR